MRNPIASLLSLLLLVLFFGTSASGQGYDIRFKINGLKDTTVLIANYYGNGTYVKDTLKVDATGRSVFKAPDSLPRGMYILVINDKKYFEFIVNNDKRFSLETDASDPAGKVTVRESPENTLFYDYMAYNRTKYGEIQALQDKYNTLKDKPDSAEAVRQQIIRMNKEVIDYKLNIVKQKPDSFMAFMINAMKEPDVPEAPLLPNGRKDSTFAYRYFKAHFWDGTDFTDDRLLRTPVFHNKLKRYFDQIVVQQPDSVILEVDRMVGKTRTNPEMFKYMVWFTTYHYENSEIMGFDKVFVHIVDTYYKTGQATWVTGSTLDGIVKKADKTRPLLIGNVAPNMIMMDTNNRFISMNSVNADFLILLFWDPDCGHCTEEIPKIRKIYEDNKAQYGIEIYAVCSDTNMVKWKKEILKRGMNWINVDGPRTLTGNYHDTYNIITTPVIYILNRKKEIIAKNLKVDQVEMFIRNYAKSQAK